MKLRVLNNTAISRRTALKAGGGLLGIAALAKAVGPLAQWAGGLSLEDLLRKHYKQMTPADIERVIKKHKQDALRKHGIEPSISDDRPIPGVKFGHALNLSTCIGCRKCAQACHEQNNHDRRTNNSYIRVLEMEQGSMHLGHGRVDYDHPVPQPGKFYMPVQCQQCQNPPCVNVCPVQATWQDEDGIVVVDYDWCIGCRYCMAACPYHARRFNWNKPQVPAEQINRDQGLMSNRIRPQGVVEKCTFCLHRTRRGQLPACLEACPAGARVFGNMLDPDSEIRQVLRHKRVFVLKEELGTKPLFFFFY